MKHPSVKDKLYRYLQQNPGFHAKGALERMEWRKKDGTSATPDNVGRRLRELAEDGKITVEQRKGHDWYCIPTIAAKPKMTYIERKGANGEPLGIWDEVRMPSTGENSPAALGGN